MESAVLPEMEAPAGRGDTVLLPFVDYVGTINAKITSIFSKTYEYLSGFRFITLHWLSFIFWSLISSIVIWICQGRNRNQRFVTCLFFAISAITTTGLAPANVSALNTFQQILLCINFILGSQPITGISVLTVRKRSMEDAFGEIIKSRQENIIRASLLPQAVPDPTVPPQAKNEIDTANGSSKHSTDVDAIPSTPLCSIAVRKTTMASNFLVYWNTFLSKATVGRNATFHGLTEAERETVVCVEYRAISLLRIVVTVYTVLHQFLGAISLALYFYCKRGDATGRNGVHPISLGVFNSISAFNNAGMSLMNDSMIPFKLDAFPVVIMSYLMLAGNTGFPIFLRVILWLMLKSLSRSPRYLQTRTTLEYTLKYPRRVYTHLFPRRETWFLVVVLMCMNAVDWIAFETSARNLPEIKDIPLGYRILDGMFQTVSVRCSGFNIVSIAPLPCALLVLYIGMMYVSAFPVTITIRTSNVYEERSLGVYSASEAFQVDGDRPSTAKSGNRDRFFFLHQQLSSQISYDAWSIMLALVVIGFLQGSERSEDLFPIFPVIFEIFSAYANIGLSMGLSNESYALCGSWKWESQLVLMFLMLRGRHRSLPVSIDRAIQLPDKNLGSREEADEREREHELVREKILAEELKID
ncbi:hypothetical protein VTL71DRAFT_39 [Oculimacula yallundae]|uniref:Low-affinity potassium transport protein n=1 Tax=Oculimacula yallundae TaxID=86028 RepID=A0ABR4CYZ8_9HELO